MKKRAALISVSDRTGLEDFARGLKDQDFTILATSGSAKHLEACGIKTLGIDEYTGQKEILDGRVKTLHPKIHAGLLARRDRESHLSELESNDMLPIDVAAVNLYPFLEKVRTEAAGDPAKMIEFIDIGGPTMIRAAAKNHGSVLPVIDPADYPLVLEFLKNGLVASRPERFREYLASKVFTAIAHYDLEIAKYMASIAEGRDPLGSSPAPIEGQVFYREQTLRYGENPHQQAAFYRSVGGQSRAWQQLQGKELSYNNLLDTDATVRIINSFPLTPAVVVIIKHANPCGAAFGLSAVDALQKAKLCDPRSHFGGIIAFNCSVTREAAEAIREDFAEVVIAEDYAPDALEVLKTSKNLRVLKFPTRVAAAREVRNALDGFLIQERDCEVSDVSKLEVVTKREPTSKELKDLQFAWSICHHVKSNAIVLANDGLIIGVGAGQMSRIDSVELAIRKATTHGHTLQGAVCASDAFFPFTDNIETLAQAGVSAIVAPAGAKRDSEVIDVANKAGISFIFAPDRHFRH